MKKIILQWGQPSFNNAELKAIEKTFKSGWLTMGLKVKIFEKKMSKYLNFKHGIAVTNGTVALDLAFKCLDIKPKDEVILPALSYISTASAISYQGAIPVFVDIKKGNYNINYLEIEKAITRKTKAIVFIDYGGNPAEVKKIKNISKKYKIPIVHDAAQSLGLKYKNYHIGDVGDISTMSFHMAKILTTVEGGMIFTNNKKYEKKLRILRNIGENKKYHHEYLGTNARMTEINASIGLVQLMKLNIMLKKRSKIAKRYIRNLKYHAKIVLPFNPRPFTKCAYFFFPILVDKRDKLVKKLLEMGIDTRIAYPMPIYKQKLYKIKNNNFKKYSCKETEKFCASVINLPIFADMKISEVDFVTESLIKILKNI